MSTKGKTIVSIIWSFGGQLFSTLILFVTNIFLAQKLYPEDFGRMGIVLFFTTIFSVFTESGFSGALIRKPNASTIDYSTVFIFNISVSLFFVLLTFIISPFIANYYNDQTLIQLLSFSSLILILNSFQITQNARMIKEMQFNRIYIYNIIATIVSSLIAILLAWNNAGVWSLVVLQIGVIFINTLLTNLFQGIFVKFQFSKKSFKELYSFGLNTTLASVIDKAFDNIYQLVLAKNFSTIQTGYFYQAKKLVDAPGTILNGVSQGVIFSKLASLQDDKARLNKLFSSFFSIYGILLGLLVLIFYVFGPEIIKVLYGSKWQGSGFYLQMLICVSFFYIQELLIRVLFKVYNKTHLILRLELLKKVIQIPSILIGIYFNNIELLIIGFVISSLINFFVYYFITEKSLKILGNKNLINYLKIIFCVSIILFSRFLLIYYNIYNFKLDFIIIFPSYFVLLWLTGFKKYFKVIKTTFSNA